ncbi:alpha/beta fold hydrolase [Actinokineospora sp. NBRC 105648]|uniref:thioesterase II family protein n=1 Tax=Actinokineospora sp. NBRC 105648 TaxID=3032206 RepID=UPI0024A3F39B|nr:alpha/beta fold hydrolase [Actinokineospora sp. NBRC 105648]GLZ36457.1 thioesterase [Actinokineospora sp. NBRC 105648]
MTTDTDLWVRRFHPAPDAPARLLCLPHAGGSASYFFPVSRAMAPRVEVLAVQYPGRQDRRGEPCVETVGELADKIADVVAPFLDKPLTLFGHSMGASVAFELGLRLQERTSVVNGVFVSGRRAPSALRDERVHEQDDDGLIAEIKRLNGTESQLLDDDEILRMVLPSIRSDYKAAETYRHVGGTRLRVPVIALLGDTDPKATTEETRRWAEHTDGEFTLELFPGGHFYLNAHVPAVIDRIRGHIDALSVVD